MTVLGPIIAWADPKRDVFDVAPVFFHIRGKPESGGVAEEHTTLLPFFHYGHDAGHFAPRFVPAGTTGASYLKNFERHAPHPRLLARRGSAERSHVAHGRGSGRAALVELHGSKISTRTRGRSLRTTYAYSSPTGHDWLTPVVGRFQRYGQSTTWWAFPTFTFD